MAQLTDVPAVDWTEAHPKREWFDVRPLDQDVYLIAEPGHVNSFLIVGSERAVLLDTGLGVANIRSVAEALAGKPVSVINSHYHFDHTGGNRLFADIAIHRLGAQQLAQVAPDGLAAGYMACTRKLIAAWPGYKALDDTYFHLVSGDTLIRPLPAGFDPGSYEIVPSHATRLLEDGEFIELGDRRLRVLHTPGHSPDSICLVDDHRGLLFGGDTLNTGPIYAQLEDSDVEAFAASTQRLATDLRDSVHRIFVCHFMRVDNNAELMEEIAEGFQRIINGDVTYRDNRDCLDYPVREACFEHHSVFVAGATPGPRV